MANDMTLFQNGANLPAHLQGASQRAAELNKGAVQGTGGAGGVDRISIKQSKFRLIEGGEEVQVLHVGAIDVAVLRVNDGVTKTYYETQWKPGQEPEAPTCYSDDGVMPSPNADKQQARTCAECPHNAWGSRVNQHTGAESKACSDSKSLAVVAADNIARNKVYRLSVPAASLKDWGKFVKQLSSVNPPIPYNAVVTRVSFDTDATFPKLFFSPTRYLTAEEYAAAEERFDEENIKLCAGLAEAAAQHARQQAGTGIPGQNPAAAAQAAVREQGAAQADNLSGPSQGAQQPPEQPAAQPEAASGFGAPEAPAPEAQQAASGFGGGEQPAQQPAQHDAASGFGSEQSANEPHAQQQHVEPEAASGFGAEPSPEQPAQPETAGGFGAPEEPQQGEVVSQSNEAAPDQSAASSTKAQNLDAVFGADWDD